MSHVSVCALLSKFIETRLLDIQTTVFVILTQLLSDLLHDLAMPFLCFLSDVVDVALIYVREIVLHELEICLESVTG